MLRRAFLAIYLVLVARAAYGFFHAEPFGLHALVLSGLGLLYLMAQVPPQTSARLVPFLRVRGRVDMPDYLGRRYQDSSYLWRVCASVATRRSRRASRRLRAASRAFFAYIRPAVSYEVGRHVQYAMMAVAVLSLTYASIRAVDQAGAALSGVLYISPRAVGPVLPHAPIWESAHPSSIPLTAAIAVIVLCLGLRYANLLARAVAVAALGVSAIGALGVRAVLGGAFSDRATLLTSLLCLLAAALYGAFMNSTRRIERKMHIPSILVWTGLLICVPLGNQDFSADGVYGLLGYISLYVWGADILGLILHVNILRLPLGAMPGILCIIALGLFDNTGLRAPAHGTALALALGAQYYLLLTRPAYEMRFVHLLNLLLSISIYQQALLTYGAEIEGEEIILLSSLGVLGWGVLYGLIRRDAGAQRLCRTTLMPLACLGVASSVWWDLWSVQAENPLHLMAGAAVLCGILICQKVPRRAAAIAAPG